MFVTQMPHVTIESISCKNLNVLDFELASLKAACDVSEVFSYLWVRLLHVYHQLSFEYCNLNGSGMKLQTKERTDEPEMI